MTFCHSAQTTLDGLISATECGPFPSVPPRPRQESPSTCRSAFQVEKQTTALHTVSLLHSTQGPESVSLHPVPVGRHTVPPNGGGAREWVGWHSRGRNLKPEPHIQHSFHQSPLGMQIKRMEVQCPRSQGFVSVSGRAYLQVPGRLSVVVLERVLCRNGIQNGGHHCSIPCNRGAVGTSATGNSSFKLSQ